jgi:DNA-directed RNA polymerase subunit RPC12/RpoP
VTIIAIDEYKRTGSTVIKVQCLTCSRWLTDQDLIFGFCPYCMEERSKSTAATMNVMAGNQLPRCAECNNEIALIGLKTWDSLAKSFKLVCTSCGEKQLAKDRQYADTPWGREKGLK